MMLEDRKLLLRLLFVTSACLAAARAQRRGSFAATKFDLSPTLPEEDLIVAGLSRDAKPTNVEKSDVETEVSKQRKRNQTTTTTMSTATVPTMVLVNEKATISTFAAEMTTVAIAEVTLTTTFPLLSSEQQQQQQQQSGTVQKLIQQQQHKSESGPSQRLLRADEWFREDFDSMGCPTDGDDVAQAFKRKFPHNLLRDGKETVLAELLATRIRECREKNARNHWSRVDAIVAQSTNVPATEREECVAGLIEEQIACMNVISYSCQFIQPAYTFRLLPTRIIVQEARYAEDGADKCRKFVRKLSRLPAAV